MALTSGGGASGSRSRSVATEMQTPMQMDANREIVGDGRKHEHGKRHCKYQIQMIDELVPRPWEVRFGSLGTRAVGVSPAQPRNAPQGAGARAAGLSPEVVLFLFQTASVRDPESDFAQEDALDVEARTMRWMSDDSNLANKTTFQIAGHTNAGSRVVVCARSGHRRDGRRGGFCLIGEVERADDYRETKFLVKPHDIVVLERGVEVYHKDIGVSCLSAGLRQGVALQAVKAPLPAKDGAQVKWCKACCYQPESVLLRFGHLYLEGVQAYKSGCGGGAADPGPKRSSGAAAPGPKRKCGDMMKQEHAPKCTIRSAPVPEKKARRAKRELVPEEGGLQDVRREEGEEETEQAEPKGDHEEPASRARRVKTTRKSGRMPGETKSSVAPAQPAAAPAPRSKRGGVEVLSDSEDDLQVLENRVKASPSTPAEQ